MRVERTSLIGGALIALAVSGGAAAASDQPPHEDAAAIAKAGLDVKALAQTNGGDADAYCENLAKARLSQSFFVPTTTPRDCSLKTEPKR